jgi:peptidoglycan-associated lipoprotein
MSTAIRRPMRPPLPAWLPALALAALLAGCGSSVKLDEAPVVDATSKPVTPPLATSTSAQPEAGVLSESKVSTVALDRSAASLASLGRVVYFDFDSFVVKEDYRAMIEGHARALAANKGRKMRVEGHTDARGGREYNLALGQKRAEAVAKSLALLGAGDAQIEAVSFGKEQPAVEGVDEAAWAKNRRAELKDR